MAHDTFRSGRRKRNLRGRRRTTRRWRRNLNRRRHVDEKGREGKGRGGKDSR